MTLLMALVLLTSREALADCEITHAAGGNTTYNLLEDALDNVQDDDVVVCDPGDHYLLSKKFFDVSFDLSFTGGSEQNRLLLHPASYGLYDYVMELDYGSAAFVNITGTQIVVPEANCGDENDNDGNGLTDADDPACSGGTVPGVGEGVPDGDDNPLDGFVDTGAPPVPSPGDLRFARVRLSGRLTLTDVVIAGWSGAEVGSFAYLTSGRINIIDSEIRSNSAATNITESGTYTDGQGVIYNRNGTTSIENTLITGNASREGGLVYQEDGRVVLNEVIAQNNSASKGGLIYASELADVELLGSRFCWNSATSMPVAGVVGDHSGGVVYATNPGEVLLRNNLFLENTANSGEGAVLASADGAKPDVFNNTFVGNESTALGGVLRIDDVGFHFWNNILHENGAGGFLYSNSFATGLSFDVHHNLFSSNPTITGGVLLTQAVQTLDNITDSFDMDEEVSETLCKTITAYGKHTGPQRATGSATDTDGNTYLNVGGGTSDKGRYGGPDAPVLDEDGDGFENIYDCNDGDSAIHPDATESCDGIDNNCDGQIDENALRWWPDMDGDGVGDQTQDLVITCAGDTPPVGWSTVSGDCDDSNPNVHEYMPEACDYIDNNCNDEVDEGYTVVQVFEDADGDGAGRAGGASTWAVCPPPGFAFGTDDCDDTDPNSFPGNTEIRGDGKDQDCDGGDLCYADFDGDGYGIATALVSDTDLDCANGSAETSATSNDCDDNDVLSYPDAPEVVGDGRDQNCDGVDSCAADVDGDGYGDPNTALLDNNLDCDDGSADLESGRMVGNTDDCDDEAAEAFPGGVEVCDGLDNDCDGELDEVLGADARSYYLDADGDGYGALDTEVNACARPAGYVEDPRDCNDLNDQVHPDAPERCDGLDNDCDGVIDDDDDIIDGTYWYPDADGDGFGVSTGDPPQSCQSPDGDWAAYNSAGFDCDDTDPEVGPCLTCSGCSADGTGMGRTGLPFLFALSALTLRRRSTRGKDKA